MSPLKNLQVSYRPYGLSALTLSLLILGTGASHSANAAVVSVTGETHDSNYNLTSVTIGGVQYSDLTGATATSVAGGLVYYLTGTTPTLTNTETNRNISLTGLSYREGTGNLLSGATFQFGRVITSSDYIFISDLGIGTDPVSFNLIDNLGGVIGDYTITLTSLGGVSLIASTPYTGTPAAVGSQAQTFGAFKLSDFSGTTGDLSSATGIRLAANSGWDPSVIGLAAAIPEPSTYAVWIAGAAALCAAGQRRRRV